MGHVQREFIKIAHQKRTLIGWGGLLIMPFIIGGAMRLQSESRPRHGGDVSELGSMIGGLANNGILLPMIVLGIFTSFLLPMIASMAGAQTIAGEAEKGTLRTSLMQPVRRTGLLMSKWFVANLYMVTGLVVLAAASLIAGAAFFGLDSITLFSGEPIGMGDTLLRIAAAFAYVFAGMIAVVSIAVLLSTVTDSSLTAAAAALVFVIVMLVLGSLSVFAFLEPYLITGHLDAWTDFFSSPIDWGPIWKGIVNFIVWSAGTMGLALLRFSRRDVVS